MLCGLVFQPARRYPRCLRDDPRMPRQASSVPEPAATHVARASLDSLQATLGVLTSMSRSHMVPGPSAPVFSLVLGVFVFCVFSYSFTPCYGCVSYIIFACPGSFRNFAPKPCIFSLTTPVRSTKYYEVYCNDRGNQDRYTASTPYRRDRHV